MTWNNPWAWLGLATLALPVLIHLLGRGHAKVLPFPSLRFLERSTLLPTRRTRLQDIPLLVVRLGILVAAVAALAQPFFDTSDRPSATSATLARAILVDTSASMRGATALETARRDAARLAREAQTSIVVETGAPARDLRGAVDWLGRQPGLREIVIVSDFQVGTMTAADIASLPPHIGIRTARVNVQPPQGAIEIVARVDDGTAIAKTTLAGGATNAEWILQQSAPTAQPPALLAAPSDRASLDAIARAATSVAVRLPLDTTRAVAVVFPSHEQHAELRRRAAPLDAAWMTDIAARLRADSLLTAAARSATAIAIDSSGLVIARDGARRPIVVAAKDDVEGRPHLLLFAAVDPASLTSAALLAAIDAARSVATPLAELEPATLSDATMAAWQRPPSAHSDSDATGSDGRWLWILALVLLALETWMRRTSRQVAREEVVRERAA